jgi:hypothetical protein
MSAISDQEAEVAEALFSLARSTPSHTGLMEPKPEVRHEMDDRTASSPATATPPIEDTGNLPNGHLGDSTKSNVDGEKSLTPILSIRLYLVIKLLICTF